MFINQKVESISESVTLKLNSLASEMIQEGKEVYNLTAGQLPENPPVDFIEKIIKATSDIKSFQYSPVLGYKELRKKIISYLETTRNIKFNNVDAFVGNGGKHVLTNILSTILLKDDEVILFRPYWISYPEMVKLNEAVPVVVDNESNTLTPCLIDFKKKISSKTKLIILNSPSNPSGKYLSESWMKEFALIMQEHPEIIILSDEIYYELNYRGKVPTYHYQYNKELLQQTIVMHGISKSFASTGLRIGWAVADETLIKGISKLQGHTSSGANSLIQKALIEYDFSNIRNFLKPLLNKLDENAKILKEELQNCGMENAWYEVNSAFYFMLDLSLFNIFKDYNSTNSSDVSTEICSAILEQTGVVIVPSLDFGINNHARISMVLHPDEFKRAIQKLMHFLSKK